MSDLRNVVAPERRWTRHSVATVLLLLTALPLALLPVALPPPLLGGAAAAGAAGAAGAAQQESRPAADFVVATFNVLGHSHTAPGRGPHKHRGFAASGVRTRRAVEVLRRTGVDLVGFQELQRPQLRQFRSATGGRWRTFSGSRSVTDNTIAWRRSEFVLVGGRRIDIPYFHGKRRPMPLVELRSRRTGQRVFVMDVHNPADARGNAARWRHIAVATERRVTARLTRRENAPVLLTGDMNDRAQFFCAFTENDVMHSVFGGSHGAGGCRPPASGIDWILGNDHVSFLSHQVDRSALVRRATDHPVVSAHVRIR